MTASARRPLRRAGRALRRSAPVVVAALILVSLVGGTVAGALAF